MHILHLLHQHRQIINKYVQMALNKKAVKIEINNNHTFAFYQKNYKVNLELYLKNYIDNTESTFIDEQIWRYKQYLSLQENRTMTNGKRKMLLDDLEHTKTVEQLRQSTRQIIEFLKAKDLKAKFEQPETDKPDEVKNLHPKHNPNDWNTDCFELFKYLIDNYYNDKKRTNTKLICIWFYLSEYNPEKYILNITKDNYLIFINENYGITITNKDKPDNYDSKVLNTLHEHRIKFEDSLK